MQKLAISVIAEAIDFRFPPLESGKKGTWHSALLAGLVHLRNMSLCSYYSYPPESSYFMNYTD